MFGTRGEPESLASENFVELLDVYLESYATVDLNLFGGTQDLVREAMAKSDLVLGDDGCLFVGGNILGRQEELLALDPHERVSIFEKAGANLYPPAPEGIPNILVAEPAQRELLKMRETEVHTSLRIEASATYEHGLVFSKVRENDIKVELSFGSELFKVHVDPASAHRIDGLEIDYGLRGGESSTGEDKNKADAKPGFVIRNPNKVRASDRLTNLLAQKEPRIALSPSAQNAFRGAVDSEENAKEKGIQVRAKRMGAKQCNYELDVIHENEKPEDAFEMNFEGLRLWVDRFSALILDQARIDFLTQEGQEGFKFANPNVDDGWQDGRAEELDDLIRSEINPGLAAHGGYVRLLELLEDTAFLEMGGGCQGCGMASVTLQQGIKTRVREALPSIVHIVDTTDHASGANPYYQKA